MNAPSALSRFSTCYWRLLKTHRTTVVWPNDVRKDIVESCDTDETGLKVASTQRSSPGRRTPKPSAGWTSTYIRAFVPVCACRDINQQIRE